MKNLLVVGHPDSGIQELEPVLRHLGFRPALPSLRDKKRPDAFLAAMRKSHSIPEAREPRSEDDFQQVRPGQAWQNLATDLLLGNGNQEPWFWSSPELLPFLEFWKEQDPGFLILMFYDEPRSVLGWGCQQVEAGDDPESFRQQLENWEAYNSAMLRFHLRNREHSLLVHGRSVLLDPKSIIKLLSERIDGGIASPGVPYQSGALEGDDGQLPVRRPELAAHFLRDAFVACDPQFEFLHEELRASALLAPEQLSAAPAAGEALADLAAQWSSMIRWVEEEKGKDDARRIFERQLVEVQESLEENYLETQGYKWRLGEAERLLASPHGAADRVKQRLAYRIGAAIVNGSKSAVGIIFIPVVLLVEIIHFLVIGMSRRNQELPPLRKYADYEASERVKRQLSYRIGQTILLNLKSPAGWFRLPSALSKENMEFKRSRRSGVSAEPES